MIRIPGTTFDYWAAEDERVIVTVLALLADQDRAAQRL